MDDIPINTEAEILLLKKELIELLGKGDLNYINGRAT